MTRPRRRTRKRSFKRKTHKRPFRVNLKGGNKITILGNGMAWIRLDMLHAPKNPITIIGDMKELPGDIYLQIEPEVVYPMTDFLIKNCANYKHIFTYNQEVLDKCPNAMLCPYGTSWISEKDWKSLPEKQWLISSVTGTKIQSSSQKFRRRIYDEQYKIPDTIPIQFFRSCSNYSQLNDFGHNPILTDTPAFPSCNDAHANKSIKILALKDSQFHIIVENSRQTNYFTEKLCDALITKNIPIYFGCPNISDFFDTSGWIIIDNENTDDLFKKLLTLNSEYYNKYIEIVNKNYNTVMNYKDYETNINRCLDAI